MNTKNVITWVIPIILFVVNICVTYVLQQFYNKNNDTQLGYLVFYLILVFFDLFVLLGVLFLLKQEKTIDIYCCFHGLLFCYNFNIIINFSVPLRVYYCFNSILNA